MVLKRANKLSGLLLAAAVLCVSAVLFIIVIMGRKAAEDEQKSFKYTALGDSIPNGYAVSEDDNLKSYPRLLAEDMENKEEIPVALSEYTKDGLTVSGLYKEYLSDERVQEDLRKSDLITVTIGANDLLKRYRELYQEIFDEDTDIGDLKAIIEIIQKEISANPQLIIEAAENIYEWDCSDFEKDWKTMMESISRNQKEDSQVIVTTIYNPVREMEELGVLSQVTEVLIDQMNSIIIDNSEAYGYQAADLSESGIEKCLQPDGLHPDQKGQQLIMENIMRKIIIFVNCIHIYIHV